MTKRIDYAVWMAALAWIGFTLSQHAVNPWI